MKGTVETFRGGKCQISMKGTVETFCGDKCQISNLHQCPEGCVIEDQGTMFTSSEQHYQFKKLKFHEMG